MALGRYLVVAVLVRLAGSGAAVALTLLALHRTHSPAFGGALVAAIMIPHVLAAPLMGALADRARHRRAFHASGLVGYGLTIVACGLLAGRAPSVLVLPIAVVGGCFGPLVFGGLSGTLRELSSTVGLARRYGLDVASYSIAGIGGPALAGLAATVAGPAPAVVLIGLLAAAGGAGVLALPLPATSPRSAGRLSLARGVTAIWRSPSLLAVTAATGLAQFGLGGLPLISALVATQRHTPVLAGALLSVMAVGGLCGSLAYARWPLAQDRAETLIFATLTFAGGALVFAALVAWLPLVFALFALAGFVGGPQGSAVFLVRDREAPTDAHTRVFTLAAGVKVTAGAIGAASAGLAAGLGASAMLLGVAGTQLLAAAVGAALLRERQPLSAATVRSVAADPQGL